MVNQMLSYADCPDCIKTVFSDVEAFLKQEDGNPADWHEKFNPVISNLETIDYEIIDPEITQDDIDEAVKRWDKLMPEYKGLLNAKFEGGE